MRRLILTAFGMMIVYAAVMWSQQKMDVAKISAPASGTKTAANSDSIVCATDTACVASLRTKNATSALFSTITCDLFAFDRSSTADVQLVAVSGATTIYVCGYAITGESGTASDVSLRSATMSDCTTGAASLTPPITVGTSTSGGMIGGIAVAPGIWSGLSAGNHNLCVHRSAAQTSEVQVWYTQF